MCETTVNFQRIISWICSSAVSFSSLLSLCRRGFSFELNRFVLTTSELSIHRSYPEWRDSYLSPAQQSSFKKLTGALIWALNSNHYVSALSSVCVCVCALQREEKLLGGVSSVCQKRVLKPESSTLSIVLWLLKEALVMRLDGLPSLLNHTFLWRTNSGRKTAGSS